MMRIIPFLVLAFSIAAIEGPSPAGAQANKSGQPPKGMPEQLPPPDKIDCTALKNAYDKVSRDKKCATNCTLSCRNEADALRSCPSYQTIACK